MKKSLLKDGAGDNQQPSNGDNCSDSIDKEREGHIINEDTIRFRIKFRDFQIIWDDHGWWFVHPKDPIMTETFRGGITGSY